MVSFFIFLIRIANKCAIFLRTLHFSASVVHSSHITKTFFIEKFFFWKKRKWEMRNSWSDKRNFQYYQNAECILFSLSQTYVTFISCILNNTNSSSSYINSQLFFFSLHTLMIWDRLRNENERTLNTDNTTSVLSYPLNNNFYGFSLTFYIFLVFFCLLQKKSSYAIIYILSFLHSHLSYIYFLMVR